MSAKNNRAWNLPVQDPIEHSPEMHSDSRWKTAGWLIFTLLLTIHFALSYSAILDYLNLRDYTHGLSPVPYQYRALPMFIFRLLVGTHFIAAATKHAPAPLNNPYQLVQFGIAFFALLGTVFATSGTITRLTGNCTFSRWFSLLIVYMAYFNLAPTWGLSYSFPYDPPSLMFFAIGVYLTVSNRIWLYYLVFPLAVLNRETICFLTIFFIIWKLEKLRERAPALTAKRVSPILLHVLAQVVIWVTIKSWLAHTFAGNSTPTFESSHSSLFSIRLFFNIKELLKPQLWPIYLSCCGFLLPALWVQRRWIQNAPISRACAVIFPLWFVGMMIVGVVPEIRIFSELSVFAVPALALIVYNQYRARVMFANPADVD